MASASQLPVPGPNPCVVPPANTIPKSYHAHPFLCVFHPKYFGKKRDGTPDGKPKFVPFYIENVVKQPPVFSAYGNKMPVLYRIVDDKNGVNTLVELKLRAPPLKSVWGVSAGPKSQGVAANDHGADAKQQPPQPGNKKAPRYTLSLAYDYHTAAGAAYFELRKDLDELALTWAAEDHGKWYANVPEQVQMGSFVIPRRDWVAGHFKGTTRQRDSVHKQTGERRTYEPQENHSIKQKQGKFNLFSAFDAAGAPIDPLTITRDAIVQSLSLTSGLYFMPEQWGWSIELVQVQKLSDGVLTECMVDADSTSNFTETQAPQQQPQQQSSAAASAFEQDGGMID